MSAGRSVADILADAKNTLNGANALSDSTAKEVSKVAPKPTASAPPKHEYSSAPYSIAKEAGDVGKELKTTMAMKDKARKALQ